MIVLPDAKTFSAYVRVAKRIVNRQKRAEIARDPWTAAGKAPSDKQRAFTGAGNASVYYVGGYRAGKSAATALKVLQRAYRYPTVPIMLCRQEYNTLHASTMQTMALALSWCYGNGTVWERLEQVPASVGQWRAGNRQLSLVGGATIQFQHLQDVQRLGSTEYGTIWIEEASEVDNGSNPSDPEDLTPPVVVMLQGRLNRQCKSVEYGDSKPQLIVTANYGGHNWVWQKGLIAPGPDTLLIETNAYDIQQHVPKDWFEQAEAWPEEYRKRHLYGSWDEFAGRVFDGFTKSNIIEQFPIPKTWPCIRAHDPGIVGAGWVWISAAYDVARLRAAKWPLPEGLKEGDLVYWWEYSPSNVPIEEQVKQVKEWDRGVPILFTGIDPSDARQQTGRGLRTTGELLGDLGIGPVVKAPNDERAFILAMNQDFIARRAWITDNCQTLIQQLRDEAYDEKAPPGEPKRKYARKFHVLSAAKYGRLLEPQILMGAPAQRPQGYKANKAVY